MYAYVYALLCAYGYMYVCMYCTVQSRDTAAEIGVISFLVNLVTSDCHDVREKATVGLVMLCGDSTKVCGGMSTSL